MECDKLKGFILTLQMNNYNSLHEKEIIKKVLLYDYAFFQKKVV